MEPSSSYQSLPALLWSRSVGQRCPRELWSRLRSQDNMVLRDNEQIVSPHRGSISTLHMDRTEGRFLLAGSSDATISIYDLSPWGRDPLLNSHQSPENAAPKSVYKPVAQSLRRTTSNGPGHSASIVRAEWYAFDTGAFVSASSDGALVVWDTQAMQPVVQWQPFPSICSFHLSKSSGRSESLLAVCSKDDTTVKLVDLRSGAASHILTGHLRGVTAVQWCPTFDVVLASGSRDGTVRLWDIRKAGSRATICTLDREESSPLPLRPYRSDFRHLRYRQTKGPNSYQDTSAVSSHSGPVDGVLFTPDGQFLVTCGATQLQLWDLRSRGHLVARNFAGSAQPPLLVVGRRVWMPFGNTKIGSYGLDEGGPPQQILDGHLGKVTALECSDDSLQLMSGAADGMILVWGCQRRHQANTPQASQPARAKRPRN
jgi:DNA excision repair protein ERCC-8